MVTSDNHMVDTNIILASVLPNDAHKKIVERYLKKEFCRYVSNTSFEEAENKIFIIKQISFCLSEHVKYYALNHSINYTKMDKSILDIKKSFLSNSNNNIVKLNLPKNRFKNLVNDLFNNYKIEITNAVINNDNEILNDVILSSFKKSIANLNNFLEDNICITFVSKGVHEQDFKNIGIHKKDAELLDQAYLLHLILDSPINFVTVDKGILELKNKILNDITSSIVVSDPIEFVSVNN